MPLVDLVGQGDGAATGSAAVQVNITLAGEGVAAATGAAAIAVNITLAGLSNAAAGNSGAIALNLTLTGQANATAAGPSALGVTLDLRNSPRPGHFLTGIARAISSATATLTQKPSPLGGDIALKASARGRAASEAQLSSGLTLIGRAAGKSVTPSVRLAGMLTLQAGCGGRSSNYGRLPLDRLLRAEAAGQASGSAGLAVN